MIKVEFDDNLEPVNYEESPDSSYILKRGDILYNQRSGVYRVSIDHARCVRDLHYNTWVIEKAPEMIEFEFGHHGIKSVRGLKGDIPAGVQYAVFDKKRGSICTCAWFNQKTTQCADNCFRFPVGSFRLIME